MDSVGTNPASAGHGSDAPIPNRRARVRHKVHTPAYASLDESSSGTVLDLSEILDITQDGMAIQTASPLQEEQSLNVSLDLSETKAFINTSGRVIWWHGSGRAGIQFPQMTAESARAIKEWLFANAIAGYHNSPDADAESDGPSVTESEHHSEASPILARPETTEPVPPDYTAVLAALGAVRREVDSLGADVDSAVQLVANRAQGFTHATGVAIALREDGNMVCRARSGNDAPDLGVRLHIGSGFSGECVRTATTLRCDDSETDPRVDPGSCRVLGIRSMLAVPLRDNASVVGLLEIFSPQAFAFSHSHHVVLESLAEAIVAAVRRKQANEASVAEESGRELPSESELIGDEPALELPTTSKTSKIILWIAGAVLLGVIIWLIASPWSRTRATPPPPAEPQQHGLASPAPDTTTATNTLEGLLKLADRGDPAAQFAIGARYATGDSVKQNYTEAVRWFTKAADQGHVVAQATLGAYYWSGRGVPQDFTKAYFWSVLAQAGGDEASKYRVSFLTSRMTRSQVIAAEQQANAWIKQHQIASNSLPTN